MKLKTPILAGFCALLVPLALNAADKHDEHAGHDHAKEEAKDEHAGHDHDGEEPAKDEHAGHDNPAPGPNKGKVFTNVEPHAELFVTKDRKLQFTFVDHDNKVVPVTKQSIMVICGKRSAPTRLTFEKKGDSLVSTKPLPAGKLIPTVMQIKTSPTGKNIMNRFNLNLNECPSCDTLEYACTCEHGHGHGHGGDHAGHDH